MRCVLFLALIASASACARTHVQPVTPQPLSGASVAKITTQCPLYIVDGVEQGSAQCDAAAPAAPNSKQKSKVAQCPLYIVDGVVIDPIKLDPASCDAAKP